MWALLFTRLLNSGQAAAASGREEPRIALRSSEIVLILSSSAQRRTCFFSASPATASFGAASVLGVWREAPQRSHGVAASHLRYSRDRFPPHRPGARAFQAWLLLAFAGL